MRLGGVLLALGAFALAALPVRAVDGPPGSAAAQEVELLPVDQAFRFEAVPRGRTVRVQATVAEGYYLYRDRVRVVAEGEGVRLGAVVKPAGEMKNDPLLGLVEVYRGRVRFDVPVAALPHGSRQVRLALTSQGCADVGVCYPPQTRTLEVTLSAAAMPAVVTDTGTALSRLSATAGSSAAAGTGGESFLPVDEAFRVRARTPEDDTLLVSFDLAPGYYLYRERMGFDLLAPASARAGEAALPEGKVKTDAYFGRQEVYYGSVTARLALGGASGEEPVAVRVTYQGCADAGLCYPPQTRVIEAGSGASSAGTLSETDQLALSLTRDALGWVLGTFFVAGLLLAFTPCVLPMIPILSAIIAGQEGASARHGFALSVVYVLAMSLTYTAAGVVAGLFGENLQAVFQHPLLLVGFSLLFVVLSLAMFGVYELQLPVALQTRLAAISHGQRGGNFTGVAVMGVLSALIVGPCVAAPLAAALIVIGTTGDPLRGGLALFALSLGMGAPLLAVGAFGPRLLPRSGPWMTLVKQVFGIMLLAVAVYLLSRLLPDAATLALWAGLALGSAWLFARFGWRDAALPVMRRVSRTVASVLLVYAVALAAGAATGAHDPLRPLDGLVSGHGEGMVFQRVKTVADLDRVVAAAHAEGRPVMLDFYADWCVSCKQMERETFSDSAVQAALGAAVLVQADVTVYDAADKALLQRFGLIGPPAILFFGADGHERRELRVIGFMDASAFGAHVTRVERS